MKKHQGFTLIELLVAITVLAIVAVLGWRGLDSIVRARVALNSELERTRGLQLAFAQMQSDSDNIASLGSIGQRPTLAIEPNRLTMVRTVFTDDQPSRVQVVAYRFRDGALLRRESIATRDLKELDIAWAAAMSDADNMPSVTLSTAVTDMSIRGWLGKSVGWVKTTGPGAGSLTLAPAPQQAAPGVSQTQTTTDLSGLEVTLQLRDRSAGIVKIFLVGAA